MFHFETRLRKNIIANIFFVVALAPLCSACTKGAMKTVNSDQSSSSSVNTPVSPKPSPVVSPTPAPTPSPGVTPTPSPIVPPSPTPTPINSANAQADWLYRSGQDTKNPQPGVVWFHDFNSNNEVNNFRWTGGYNSGNDPLAVGNTSTGNPIDQQCQSEIGSSCVHRLTTDGVTGGDCLEILRPAGSNDPSMWWRPLSPIVATGNGRTTNDPGAGKITPQAYSPTDGGSQISNWGSRGYYGQGTSTSIFDGKTYFLQLRIKMDPRRTTAGNVDVGKLMYQTITNASNTPQELVTYSNAASTSGIGVPNYFRMYGLGNYSALEQGDSLKRPGQQVGSALANYTTKQYCNVDSGPANCWYWSGGWDTIMYQLTPGGNGTQDTVMRVYAAHQGTTAYTLIWDETYATKYDTSYPLGYNAVILSAYQNGTNNTEFWQRYDQVIFSQQFIPCPQY